MDDGSGKVNSEDKLIDQAEQLYKAPVNSFPSPAAQPQVPQGFDPENSKMNIDPSRRKYLVIFLAIMTGLYLLVGVLSLLFALHINDFTVPSSDTKTEATVLSCGWDEEYLTFQAQDNQTIRFNYDVFARAQCPYAAGSKIKIAYDSRDPSRHIKVYDAFTYIWAIGFYFIAVFMLCFSAFFVYRNNKKYKIFF